MSRKVLVTDPIAQDGIDALAAQAEVDVRLGISPEELMGIIGEYDALVVRSETKVTASIIEAAKKLQVIGRAGVGVDNIDVEAATQRGDHRCQRPVGEHDISRRARDRADAGAVAAHPSGQRHPQERRVGPQELHGRGGAGQDAGDHRPGADRVGGGAAGARPGDAGHRL